MPLNENLCRHELEYYSCGNITPERLNQMAMNEIASRAKRLQDVQLKAAQQQSVAMQFLQAQQQQLQAMQQQVRHFCFSSFSAFLIGRISSIRCILVALA